METRIERPAALIPKDVIERARKFGSALLADGMKALNLPGDGCMDYTINPVDSKMSMAGTAFTLESENGDNLPIHLAMKLLEPGYVMVIDGKGYEGKAYLGDLLVRQAAAMGAVGIVIDGCVRDREELTALGFPVYARGIMQRGPGKSQPGRINCPITCAGVPVNPGDLVVGDSDGVTVVPCQHIEHVLAAAGKKAEYEFERRSTIADYMEAKRNNKPAGNLSPAWVDEQLVQLGVKL
ncbi:MAG: RraA family protein [Christensenellales bacterium]|jgi:4-hydroxy-4-methyl-2-oxoglutarate aldolase